MTEQSGNDNYIKCTNCKCKYINDDEHIKTDFGYNRLNERHKTCVKCRERNKRNHNTQHNQERRKQYYQDNKNRLDELTRKARQARMTEEVDDDRKTCIRCLKPKLHEEFKPRDKRIVSDTVFKTCESCRICTVKVVF